MPIYEYLCEACQERSELLQRLSDPPATVCPRCGGTLKKLVSAPSFQFKGSGWYLTDYAKKSGAGEGEGKAKGESAKGDSGKSAEGGGTPSSSEAPAAPAPATPAATPAAPAKGAKASE